MIPIALASVGDAKIAIKLISEPLKVEKIIGDYPIDKDSDMAIQLHGDFTWESATLPDANGGNVILRGTSKSTVQKIIVLFTSSRKAHANYLTLNSKVSSRYDATLHCFTIALGISSTTCKARVHNP